MGESSLEAIYDLVCSSKDELKKIKEDIKKDKELKGCTLDETLIKSMQRRGDDDDDDDEV